MHLVRQGFGEKVKAGERIGRGEGLAGFDPGDLRRAVPVVPLKGTSEAKPPLGKSKERPMALHLMTSERAESDPEIRLC